MNPNMNQVNPYLQLSNTTPPPMSQPSSMPIPMGTMATPVMATTDNLSGALNAVNVGMSSLGLGQTPVYAISSNIANTNPHMACVQNVQLKADNGHGIELCSDNSHMMSAPVPVSTPQMFELVPAVWGNQRVANIQSPHKPALNRNQYSNKAQPNAANDNPNDRPDRRYNSSSNASHNRKYSSNSLNRSKPNGVAYGQNGPNRSSNSTAAENQCQNPMQNHSIPNPSAFQGMPFVKHQYNNRFHTIPVGPPQPALNCSQPSMPKMNGTSGPHRITKIVNGVEIFAMSNFAGGDVDGYGYAKTPPLPNTGPNRRSYNSSQMK